MRRVRVVAQRIQKENVEAGEFLLALRWNLAVVRKIRAIAKFESICRARSAVIDADRLNCHPLYGNWIISEDDRTQAGPAGLTRRIVKHVMERSFDDL